MRWLLIAAMLLPPAMSVSWIHSDIRLDTFQHPTNDCTPEPASQWAPAGWICPPLYGDGTASTWGGPGAARNDCVWAWRECPPLVVTALSTGRSIVLTPVMWCMCWVGTVGPNGETARIIDLDPSQVAALGLDASIGLFDVRVEPATVALPDTRMP